MGRSRQRNPQPSTAPLGWVPVDVQEMELATLYGYVAKAQREVLNDAEAKALHASLETLAFLLEELKRKGATLRRLQAMLFGSSSEKTENVFPAAAPVPPEPENAPGREATVDPDPASEKAGVKPKAKGHGRNPASCYHGAEQILVPHPDLSAGDPCPECPKGKVYPMAEPAVLVRVVGMSPLSAKVVELDRLRCNGCGEVFKVPAPEGMGEEKYDETATSMISMLRYGTGTPFYRLAKLQSGLGIPLPAGTQWKLALEAAGILEPAFQELITWAAQGDVIYQDDTTMKVLSRPDLVRRGTKQRKGVYTSGLISKVGENWVALFLTGMNHAGENLAEVLRRRKAELGRPIQMCDAASANTAGDLDTIVAHCLAHARRRFVDVADDFPEACRHLLESLREVYLNDAETKGMSPSERLRFHQEHSGQVMERLRAWLQDQFEQKRVEPNSGLGTAITYMLKHWERLTLFLREPAAPLDSNKVEASLKRAILHRKNSLFYKTLKGAHVGDVFMSLIHSAELNKVNPFEYLVALQRYHALVEENPEEWMPWNYADTLAELGLAE
ncbi:MAG: IS66 family transposase [Holophagaceae bacterium]|nr:IS66 family transposase [Holophagaceae bacterium]